MDIGTYSFVNVTIKNWKTCRSVRDFPM